MGLTCRASRHPPPDEDVPLTEWFRQAAKRVFEYEPCGKPAEYSERMERPMCAKHADEVGAAAQHPDTVVNVLRGQVSSRAEAAGLVRRLT